MNLPDAALVVIIAFSAIYYVITTTLLCIRRKRQNTGAPAGNLPPVTLLRPVKRGVPDLEARLRELVASVHPGDQILVGVDDPASLAIAEKIPGLEIVQCVPGPMFNRKVSKLSQMTPQARNAHWIISDSESIFSREFLDGFRADWLRGDAVTAGYVFHGARNVPELLDHIAAILTLWPGLMLAPRRFTLGACTGLLQSDLETIGGWEAIGSHLAEDNQLGTLLTKAGKRIIFSRWVLPLDGDRMGFASYLRHQLRIAVTVPGLHAGGILRHGAYPRADGRNATPAAHLGLALGDDALPGALAVAHRNGGDQRAGARLPSDGTRVPGTGAQPCGIGVLADELVRRERAMEWLGPAGESSGRDRSRRATAAV
ncbi:MAG: glycosyltransferase [Chthoniobacteraceae bacterium]